MDFGDEPVDCAAPHLLRGRAVHALVFAAVAVVAVSADADEVEGVDDLLSWCFRLEHCAAPLCDLRMPLEMGDARTDFEWFRRF